MAWDPQQRELVRLGPFLLRLVRDRAVLSQQTLSPVRVPGSGPRSVAAPPPCRAVGKQQTEDVPIQRLAKTDSGGIWLTGRSLPGPGLEQQFSNLLVL